MDIAKTPNVTQFETVGGVTLAANQILLGPLALPSGRCDEIITSFQQRFLTFSVDNDTISGAACQPACICYAVFGNPGVGIQADFQEAAGSKVHRDGWHRTRVSTPRRRT